MQRTTSGSTTNRWYVCSTATSVLLTTLLVVPAAVPLLQLNTTADILGHCATIIIFVCSLLLAVVVGTWTHEAAHVSRAEQLDLTYEVVDYRLKRIPVGIVLYWASYDEYMSALLRPTWILGGAGILGAAICWVLRHLVAPAQGMTAASMALVTAQVLTGAISLSTVSLIKDLYVATALSRYAERTCLVQDAGVDLPPDAKGKKSSGATWKATATTSSAASPKGERSAVGRDRPADQTWRDG